MVISLSWASTDNLDHGIELITEGKRNAVTFYQRVIGNEGIASIAQALVGNKSCLGLSLQGTGMGDAGLIELSKVLNSTAVTWLSISDNACTEVGIKAFAEALKENRTLTELHLHDNPIGNAGGEHFASCLQYNFSILNIYFAQCGVTREKLRTRVRELLGRNKNLEQTLWEDSCKSGEMQSWLRAKLMVIGQGRAGKSCTVRSLLGKQFDPNLESTIGADLVRTEIHQDASKKKEGVQAWEESTDQSFAGSIAAKVYLKLLNGIRKPGSSMESGEYSEAVQNAIIQYHSNRESYKSDGGSGGDSGGGDLSLDLDVAKRFDQELILNAQTAGDAIRYSIWDYGGQEVFYTLHHLFLTRYGLYLLVFNMRELLDSPVEATEYLTFWLNSVSMHAESAPVMIVGTFLDKIKSQDELDQVNSSLENLIGKKYRQIVRNDSDPDQKLCFFPVNNKDSDTITVVRDTIEEVTKKQDYVNTKVKISWMGFLDQLVQNSDRSWYTLEETREIALNEFNIDRKECDRLLDLFHELGIIVHLKGTENLRNIVTTNPQWLIDSISKVIRDKNLHKHDADKIKEVGLSDDLTRMTNDAILSRDLMNYFWGRKEESFLLDLMERTMLLSAWDFGEEDMFLVPSLLDEVDTLNDTEDETEAEGFVCDFDFTETFLPTGVFQRLVCLCVAHSGRSTGVLKEPILYKTSAKLWFDDNAILLRKMEHKIRLVVLDEDYAAKALSVMKSMLMKIRFDCMGNGFAWKVMLEKPKTRKNGKVGNLIPYDKAMKSVISPWFTREDSSSIKSKKSMQMDLPVSFELNGFLNSL